MGEQLRIVSDAYFRELEKAVEDPDTLRSYRDNKPLKLDEGRLLPTLIVVDPAPKLKASSTKAVRAKEDAENAMKLYRWLPALTRTQAWDRRLWSTLCHFPFFKYVRARWAEFTSDTEKDADYVTRHWFLGAKGKAALRTNAISRLWWAAYLTWKPWNKDPDLQLFKTQNDAHYTQILLSNQQFYFDIIERDFGSSLRVRICLLDALQQYRDEVASDTKLSGGVAKRLNLVARTRHLDSIPVKQLRELCLKLVQREVRKLNNGRPIT